MQKKILISYLIIFTSLLVIMSLSHPSTEKLRGTALALVSPLWEKIGSSSNPESSENQEIQKLKLENQLLSNELSYLRLLASYEDNSKQMQSLPARVLMRTFDTWNNSLWINVGYANNLDRQQEIVAKNSPVLIGKAVVGIIDYVGKHQSRVRLITDPGLTPSVRAVRGGEQEKALGDQIDLLLSYLKQNKKSSDQKELVQSLVKFKSSLNPSENTLYLAKGELQGSKPPRGRGSQPILKGIGFNYDFTDAEGEGRDLRTGKPLKGTGKEIPILKVNDILVTTGMDAVFPPGLQVATVTKIALLQEGDYFYSLEAKPFIPNMDELTLVFVIPPIAEANDDQ